ncbi:MAG: glycosyltransferase family 4 protein, partial [Verrucomicrobiales bacterium]
YPPDGAPTGRVLERVVWELVDRGHEVTVVCSEGGYAAMSEPVVDMPGVRMVRLPSGKGGRASFMAKLSSYIGFYLRVMKAVGITVPTPDRIVALTTPPYLSLLARVLSRFRGADHGHWVMDLYPDVMSAHGMLREGALIDKVLGGLTRWGFGGKRCARVVVLGPDMSRRIGRYVDGGHVGIVPLWPTAAAAKKDEGFLDKSLELRASRGWRDDEVVLMYSGNMGRGHRFQEFLTVAKDTRENVRWVFFGAGPRRAEVEQFLADHPESSVSLGDYVAHERLGEHLESGDVQLVSLEPEWDGTMVPSKFQGVFAAGKPVIFVGSRSSSLGTWIEESGAGWVVEPGEVEQLREIVTGLTRDDCVRRGRLAREFAEREFSPEKNSSRVADLFSSP